MVFRVYISREKKRSHLICYGTKNKDFIHKVRNIVLPPTTFLLLLLFLPPFLVFKFVSFSQDYVPENIYLASVTYEFLRDFVLGNEASCSYFAIPLHPLFTVLYPLLHGFDAILSLSQASKATRTSLFETLRAEPGSDIGITIVYPGVINLEMNQNLSKVELDQLLE
ncbi:uncharacterized protein LOC111290332 [Durio zibethinus]|uniref:Uncharacterized protein LOC111290332 n=1 Tax=Durio zibethinus TaxID=66656 RepID=A0A6P5YA70_DURZI|nr:uncharacterized protein LOC111290332 [Durio zibethinus]